MAAAPAQAQSLPDTPGYSLPLALQESLYFYDAQKSGPARTDGDQPLSWRGDDAPSDSCVPLQPMADNVGTNLSASFIAANQSVLDPDNTGCLNLSGGFHDAGDTVKFGLPQTYAASVLGWSMYEFPQAYQATGTWAHAMDEMKWFSDYFLRSTFLNSSGQVVAFAYQVGEGSVDHDYWGPSELESSDPVPAPGLSGHRADARRRPGRQRGRRAGRRGDPDRRAATQSYSAECLKYAEALYSFAVANPGIGYSGGFYNSSGYQDKEAWAAVWLYLATGTWSYINDIVAINASGDYTGYLGDIVQNTTDYLAEHLGDELGHRAGAACSRCSTRSWRATRTCPPWTSRRLHYVNKWQVQYWSHVPHDNASDTNFIATTPAGFSYLTSWGSARYNTAAQLEALVYRKNFPTDPDSVLFTNWAMGQMNYLMGDNPANWSYIVGFGSNVPYVGSEVGGSATAASHPHQGDAQGSLTNSQTDPLTDQHILWGALVGGPSSTDQPDDVTTDFVLNEVAVDYNAAFVGALAGLYQYYGQSQPMTDFTPPSEPQGNCAEYQQTCSAPYYATATLNQDSDQGTQLTVTINNMADEPPHLQSGMSARVYFDISSLHAQGQDISDISTPVYYDAADQIDGNATSVSAPVQWGDANSCIYYVTVNWGSDQIGLPPSRAFEFGINAAIGPQYKFYWNSAVVPVHDRPGRGHVHVHPGPVHPGLPQRALVLRADPVADRGRGLRFGQRQRRHAVGDRRVRGVQHRGHHVDHQQPDRAGEHRHVGHPAVRPDRPVLVHRGRHRPARLRVRVRAGRLRQHHRHVHRGQPGGDRRRSLPAAQLRQRGRVAGARREHRRHPERDLPEQLRHDDADQRLLVQRRRHQLHRQPGHHRVRQRHPDLRHRTLISTSRRSRS